ncbi:MAG: hypothetical protein KDE63_03970 [Novosphingobium sp.]|nr:hypothetical protein [Novosphingobium sp.]
MANVLSSIAAPLEKYPIFRISYLCQAVQIKLIFRNNVRSLGAFADAIFAIGKVR